MYLLRTVICRSLEILKANQSPKTYASSERDKDSLRTYQNGTYYVIERHQGSAAQRKANAKLYL